MSRSPKAWLVTYDVADDRRRTRIYNLMRGYGDHIQFSVFRCVLSDRQLAELRARLEPEVHAHEDQVLLVPLGSPEPSRFAKWITVGRGMEAIERTVLIL